MTIVQYLTKEPHCCGTSGEIIKLSREDKGGFETLKKWAREEMINRGVVIDEPAGQKIEG